jgi:hypothetical protein
MGTKNDKTPSRHCTTDHHRRATRETFDLYDSLLFIGKLDLSPYGIKRVRTVYENELWPPKRTRRRILLLRCESSATGIKLRVLTIVDTFSPPRDRAAFCLPRR